jgi:RNA polymerase sigma-70 factor (ECF subfamily)
MMSTSERTAPALERGILHLVSDTDADLLCRIAEQDLSAFEMLYGRYARAVYAIALRRLRDRGHAEDATQEVFAAVWRFAATYAPERGPAARWLFTVARNTVTDHGRVTRRLRDALQEEAPEPVSDQPGPDQAAEDAWISFCMHAAVTELPERERVPLELAYWGGQSQAEIARQLGVPLGTVKTRTRSGLARLAARLEGVL